MYDIELPNSSKIVNIETLSNNKIKGNYFTLSMSKGKNDFVDPKTYVSFIKSCEKLIRTSEEYNAYIGYLKNEIGLTSDALMPNVDHDKTAIEFHHSPFTLFDICCIIVDSLLSHEQSVNTFQIAKIVMEEHFDNHITLVPLSKTSHELAHSGTLFINHNMHFGHLDGFIDRYRDGLTSDHIHTYNNYMSISSVTKTNDSGSLEIDIKEYNKNKNDVIGDV